MQNPDLIEEIKEEIKQEPAIQKTGRSINQSIEELKETLPEETSSQSILELDVQDLLSDGDAEETQALLSELQQNPNPEVQNGILVDLEMRR